MDTQLDSGRSASKSIINDDEALFEEDYNTGFVKTLLRVQNNIVTLPNGKEHFDIYLSDTIYPTLVPALESLAREIDRLTTSDGKILETQTCRTN